MLDPLPPTDDDESHAGAAALRALRERDRLAVLAAEQRGAVWNG